MHKRILHSFSFFLNSLQKQRISFSTLVIFFVIISITWINFNTHPWNKKGGVIKHDILGYYSYLPAALIYKDLSFRFTDNDPAFFGDKLYRHIAPNGGRYQKMTMGISFLYLPFFLMGHITAFITGAEVSGYSPPYLFFLQFSSLVYLIIGLIFIRRILLQYFRDWIVAMVLLVLVFGTGVLFYTTFEAAMSHTYSFCLFAIFIWLSIRWHEERKYSTTISLGLIFGLIILIRPTNGLIILFFILFNVNNLKDLGARVVMFASIWHKVLLMICMFFLVLLPQMIFWKINTGQWIFYSYGNEGFFFLKPEITNGLFSYRKGWLLYTPLMIFALAGIFLLYNKMKGFFIPVLAFTILNIYVVYSWWSWWYGGGFGSRPMIDSYPLMAIPLATFILWVSSKIWSKIAVIALLILLGCHGTFQTAQYHYGSIHYEANSKASYWHSFGKLRPRAPYWDFLQPPDVHLAIKGIQAIAPKSKLSVETLLQCNYDSITPNDRFFFSNDGAFLVGGAPRRSNNKARSGNYSLCLYENAHFGSDIQLEVKPKEKYKLSVWKYPHNGRGLIVFAAPVDKEFYAAAHTPALIDDDGWGKIEVELTIPDVVTGRYKIYIWNPGNDSVYYDDLLLEKLLVK